ncbi:MAG: hypothetical protein ACRCTJ_00210, partial [Brevinema sp.]
MDRVPKKNAISVTAFNVKMNDGYIGHTSVIFDFLQKQVLIKPVPIPNMAAMIEADLGKRVWVYIKALDVDGDFVAKNLKLPFFGLADSRYRGDFYITKSVIGQPVLLSGKIDGYLDGEKQIEAEITGSEGDLKIPKFYFISQDLLLHGDVSIQGRLSNTIVQIDAFGQLNTNEQIPVNVQVLIQKTNALVTGLIDNTINLNTKSDSINTDFSINFKEYSLSKLGLLGNLTGKLGIDFDLQGWKNFYVHNAIWAINDQKLKIGFNATRLSNVLDVTNLQIGLNTETLRGDGYFHVSDKGNISGAFNFQRGGSLSFATASYTWKFSTDIYNFYIADIGKLPVLDQFGLPEQLVSSVLMDLNFNIQGCWSNPNIRSKLTLKSTGAVPYFQLVIPELTKQKNTMTLTNFRLRSDDINIDTDLLMDYNDDYLQLNLSGAFSFQELAKSKYSLSLFSSNQVHSIQYQLSNFYLLSKKPMDISGQIIDSDDQYLLLSDQPLYGIAGVYIKNKKSWDLKFKSDSVEIHTGGYFTNNNDIYAMLSSRILFDKMAFSGDIRKMKGSLSLNSLIEGDLDNPRIYGNLSIANLYIHFNSLKNKITIPDKITIPISNNLISFPDIAINAGRDNPFYLNGSLEFRDRAISEANLTLYSKKTTGRDKASFLDWNIRVPYINLRGKTLIDRFALIGTGNRLALETDITTENINIGLELADSFSGIGRVEAEVPEINPAIALLGVLDLNLNINVQQGFRFFNQLFDLTFEKNAGVITLQGNLSDNTILVTGDMDISKGWVNYLNTDLKVESGTLQFPQEIGDPFPQLNLQTVTTKFSSQSEQVDIYVNFQGKLPNVELASLSSNPSLQTSELLNILSGGSVDRPSGDNTSLQSTGEALASGVLVAENVLFTSPLSQRIQQLLPFIDLIQIKTDFLGNITRVLSSGGEVTGLSILHGSELSIGQFIPNLPNIQVRYDLRLESPDNTSVNSGTELIQIHKAGLEWSYPINNWRFGIRPSIL